MTRCLRGYSLIELMVALVILSLLFALGLPQFTNFVRDARVRAAAENFLAGVQLARAEAVRRNAGVEFLLTANDPLAANVASATASATGGNWMVRTADLAVFLEGKFAVDGGGAGSSAIRINDTTTPASADPDAPPATPASTIVFNGLGRTNLAADAIFKFTSPQGKCVTDGGPVRCLRVVVSVFGQTRLCDPRVGAGDTRSC